MISSKYSSGGWKKPLETSPGDKVSFTSDYFALRQGRELLFKTLDHSISSIISTQFISIMNQNEKGSTATQPVENGGINGTIPDEKDVLEPDGVLKGAEHENGTPNEDPEKVKPAIFDIKEKPWSVWTPRQVKMIIVVASFASLLSPLSGQIYFPALNSIAADLHVSDSLVNLSITTYLVSLLPAAFRLKNVVFFKNLSSSMASPQSLG